MTIATFFMIGAKLNYEMSKGSIEVKARGYGMSYPDEMKVIIEGGAKK